MQEQLRELLLERCRAMEIPMVGIGGVGRWEHPPFTPWMPEAFYPQSIFPEARSVIVIGLPVDLPVLETAPSIYYHELYTTVNTLLDQYTYRLASYLNEMGYPSVFVPRDGYGGIEALLENPVAFFSHRHAAYLAGLGNFGVNNMLLTPEYGPRVRFGSVLTAAILPEDPILEGELCTRCMACVERCPARALREGEYPATLTDKKACVENSERLSRKRISPCGICLKVCPVGRDRVHFRREDSAMYTDRARYPAYHRAWKHVRSYGRKK